MAILTEPQSDQAAPVYFMPTTFIVACSQLTLALTAFLRVALVISGRPMAFYPVVVLAHFREQMSI